MTISSSINSDEFTIRGRRIHVDNAGRVSLNDIHKAAGYTRNQKPVDWLRLSSANQTVSAVVKKATGKSHSYTKNEIKSVLCVKNGSGTWVHENVALAYASYLSPDLAVEIRDVFIRYKHADPTLADDVLNRGTPQDNEWAGVRALSRAKRNDYTKTLCMHGVAGAGYANCTNAIYNELFDKDAKGLRVQRNIPKKANVRNSMDSDELVAVMFAETLSKGRIAEEQASGNVECQQATSRSSRHVRLAIDADRSDRQMRLA